jgi:uncharacterized membrane protein
MAHLCKAEARLSPDLVLHIAAGAGALGSGFGALLARKGTRAHAWFGTAFFVTMLAMCLLGSAVAARPPERGTFVIGLFTAYLVVTAWRAARHRNGPVTWVDAASLVASLSATLVFAAMGLIADMSPNGRIDSLPGFPHYIFAAVAAIAGVTDLRVLMRGGVAADRRIVRHLWRMSTAMLIATTSFFLGQADEFPRALRETPLPSLPILFVAGALIYWLIRTRRRGTTARPA